MNLIWPSTIDHILAWSELVLFWMIANYAAGPDPTSNQVRENHRLLKWSLLVVLRSLALGLVLLLIMRPLPAAFLLGGLALAGALILPAGRSFLVMRDIRWIAEWEILVNVVVLTAAALTIGHAGLGVGAPVFPVPLPAERLATVWVAAAAFVFAGRGATHVVRGILDKVGTVPKTRAGGDSAAQQSGEVDTQEYNRGRVIGVLERWLLIATVMLGTYAALGLLVAAKGLVRIKELEDRDFSEYFLIGTLTSVLLALVLGLLVRAAVTAWW